MIAPKRPARQPGAALSFSRMRLGPALALVLTVVAVMVLTYFITTPKTAPATSSGTSTMVVGQPVPDFSATSLNGEPITLHQFRGQPVWLVFNATWCAGCRAEAPDLEVVAKEVASQKVAVISVYKAEEATPVRNFTTLLGLTFTHIPDPQSRISSHYRVSGVPAHYFIDANGVLKAIRSGALNQEKMRAAVAEISAH